MASLTRTNTKGTIARGGMARNLSLSAGVSSSMSSSNDQSGGAVPFFPDMWTHRPHAASSSSILLVTGELNHKDFSSLNPSLVSSASCPRVFRELVEHCQMAGFHVVLSNTLHEAENEFISHANLSCVLIDWDIVFDVNIKTAFLNFVKKKNSHLPVFLLMEKKEFVQHTRGTFSKNEETAPFVVKRLKKAANEYSSAILPPFFKRLMELVQESEYSWHTPGHKGGSAFLRSPTGKIFFDFFGENFFRADISISVSEMGSLLRHSGVVNDSEREASHTFRSSRTYFVTNGTSTANKMVFHGTVTKGDRVLVDRNCHKSICHSLIITDSTGTFMRPTSNKLGIIGPIPLSRFEEDSKTDEPFRLMVLTNSTFDGLCYNVSRVIQALKGRVQNFHFDEAWFAHATFHPFYADRFGMHPKYQDPAVNDVPIFTTQSTHKLLAAVSQASMLHTLLPNNWPETPFQFHEKFNEAFMMHTSTSPLYPIIASLDVAVKTMALAGEPLAQCAIEEAIAFRREMAKRHFGHPSWFKVWQPTIIATSDEDLVNPKHWKLTEEDNWHGFSTIKNEDDILLDPTKVTIITPDHIPAPIVVTFLRCRGIEVAKSTFKTFLLLFSHGVTMGNSSSLVSELDEFFQMYERDVRVTEVLPGLESEPWAQTLHIKAICDNMWRFLEDFPQTDLDHLPEIKMPPADAYRMLVRRKVKTVTLDEALGRASAVLVVPYPPGIPLLMPGEIINEKMIAIFKFHERFNQRYPGLETEIHGMTMNSSKKFEMTVLE
jgi:lysine decarboxylase/arginine decarboxylase